MAKPPDNTDNGLWARARLARSKLEHDVLSHPAVTMIDIGYLSGASRKVDDELVLRIHIGEQWLKASADKQLPFPREMDGFKIIVIRGDYKLG